MAFETVRLSTDTQGSCIRIGQNLHLWRVTDWPQAIAARGFRTGCTGMDWLHTHRVLKATFIARQMDFKRVGRTFAYTLLCYRLLLHGGSEPIGLVHKDRPKLVLIARYSALLFRFMRGPDARTHTHIHSPSHLRHRYSLRGMQLFK